MTLKSNDSCHHTALLQNMCWIHLQDLKFFVFLGVNPHEKKLGQNITVHLSLQIPYENTGDKIENTLDYGLVIECLKNEMTNLKEVNLLEYLCELLLNKLGENFKTIQAAKIQIQKGYVPLAHYTGSVTIEACKQFVRA